MKNMNEYKFINAGKNAHLAKAIKIDELMLALEELLNNCASHSRYFSDELDAQICL